MKKGRNEMNVPTQVIGAETPAARPQDRAGDVVRRESPPRHLQNSGDDPVQLPQAVEKAGEQNNYSAAALEKIIEVLLTLRVDLELVQCHPSAPAADGVADAIPDVAAVVTRIRSNAMLIRPSAASRAPAMSKVCPGVGIPIAFRHHGRECRAVTVALQQRLHSRK